MNCGLKNVTMDALIKNEISQQWIHRYWCLLLLKVEQPK